MLWRAGEKYSLDEILFYINDLDQVDKLAEFAGRSESAVNSKLKKVFGQSKIPVDGPTTLKSILQYESLGEIYQSFGEQLPLGEAGEKDFQRRVNNFRKYMENKYE